MKKVALNHDLNMKIGRREGEKNRKNREKLQYMAFGAILNKYLDEIRLFEVNICTFVAQNL